MIEILIMTMKEEVLVLEARGGNLEINSKFL